MHRTMAREAGIGVKQKGITVSVGCVATGECQNVKWLGKGTVGRMQETQGQQDRTGQGSAGDGKGNKEGMVCKAQGIPGVQLLGHVLGFAPLLPFDEGIDGLSGEVHVQVELSCLQGHTQLHGRQNSKASLHPSLELLLGHHTDTTRSLFPKDEPLLCSLPPPKAWLSHYSRT